MGNHSSHDLQTEFARCARCGYRVLESESRCPECGLLVSAFGAWRDKGRVFFATAVATPPASAIIAVLRAQWSPGQVVGQGMCYSDVDSRVALLVPFVCVLQIVITTVVMLSGQIASLLKGAAFVGGADLQRYILSNYLVQLYDLLWWCALSSAVGAGLLLCRQSGLSCLSWFRWSCLAMLFSVTGEAVRRVSYTVAFILAAPAPNAERVLWTVAGACGYTVFALQWIVGANILGARRRIQHILVLAGAVTVVAILEHYLWRAWWMWFHRPVLEHAGLW